MFAKQPHADLILVVREFYANAEDHREFKAYMRGKWIPFDKTSINRFYNLLVIDNDNYSRPVKREFTPRRYYEFWQNGDYMETVGHRCY